MRCLDEFMMVTDGMQQRHAISHPEALRHVFPGRRAIPSKHSSANRAYVNQRIPVGVSWNKNTIYKDKAAVWLEHRNRRQFLGGVVMDPTNKAPADCWNLWQGFAVEPQPGDWSF